MDTIPVTILEADISFWPEDDLPTQQAFIGGCAENIVCSDDYEKRSIEYPGVATAKKKKINESHVIEIGNLWLIDTSQDPPVVPDIDPDATYQMIIEWTDEDTGYRAMRTYTGVTIRGQRVTTPNQNLTFDAETMLQEGGVPA
jgi:hypothetical protein